MGMFGREIVSVIDVSKEDIKIITVGIGRSRFELLQYIREQILNEPLYTEEGEAVPPEEAKRERLAEAFDSAFREMKYKPSYFVLSVPSEFSIVRTISIPFRGVKKVNSVLKFELEPHVPFPIEELKLDYFIAYEGKKETDLLVLGVRDMHMSENISVLEEFSVSPESAVVDSLGLAYLWGKLGKDKQKLRAGLIIDRDFSIFAVAKGSNLVFLRHLFIGREGFNKSPEVFSREVQNSIRSFLAKWKGEDKIEEIELWGVKLSEGELELFSNLVKLVVIPVDFSNFVINKNKNIGGGDELIDLYRFVGIAGLSADPNVSFNLLKEGQDLTKYLPMISRHFIFTNCLILTGLVIFAFLCRQIALANIVQAKLYEAEAESIAQEMEQISAEKGLDENVDLGIFFVPPFIEILAKIGEIFSSDKVDITEVRVAPPDNQGWWIRIQGKTKDSSFINVAISKLREVEYFEILDEPELSAQGDLTSFAIKIQRGGVLAEDSMKKDKVSSSNPNERSGE